MHLTVQNLVNIKAEINSNLSNQKNHKVPKIIAVSKTFSMDKITPLIEYGHLDFGENKVQEAEAKWSDIKSVNKKIKLHMVGKLQSNKAKSAYELFDYIHSLDNLKLANKISNELQKKAKEIKIFIQVNLGGETQKSGIHPSDLKSFYKQCVELNLNIIGTMCIPPDNQDPKPFFKDLLALNREINLSEISMGMTNDYLDALEYRSTFLRIGTGIFGQRTK